MWCITRQPAKFTLAETCVTKLVVLNLTTKVAGGRFRHLNTLPGHFRWTLVESGHAPRSQTKSFPPTLPRKIWAPFVSDWYGTQIQQNLFQWRLHHIMPKNSFTQGSCIYMFKLMRYVYINHSPQYKRQRPAIISRIPMGIKGYYQCKHAIGASQQTRVMVESIIGCPQFRSKTAISLLTTLGKCTLNMWPMWEMRVVLKV